MTASSPQLGEPRWHADPAGGKGLRWWDGAQWTTAVMGPAALGPSVQQPLPADTVVYTVPFWVIVLLPVLSTLGVLLMPAPSLSSVFEAQATGEPAPFDSAGLLRNLLSFSLYAASVALAWADRRALLRAGYLRPFHWAWAFLGTGVYVVGRSIIVQRRIDRGLTLMWVWAGITVLGMIVSFATVAEGITALLESPALG